jgi:RecA-family ATPase
VVVDTWQRVRPRKRAFKDDYETDYAHLGQLQTMAHEHNCAILLVHHARKDNEGAEKQDSLLGSTAIAGAADLIWILERKHNSSEGLITPSGRDIEDETPLAFKCENGVWQYLGRKSEVEMNDSQKRVMEFFKDKGPQRFSEIKKALGINPATLTRALNALVAKREIEYLEISKLYKNLRTTELEENDVVFN